jgi:hypothetical protein
VYSPEFRGGYSGGVCREAAGLDPSRGGVRSMPGGRPRALAVSPTSRLPGGCREIGVVGMKPEVWKDKTTGSWIGMRPTYGFNKDLYEAEGYATHPEAVRFALREDRQFGASYTQPERASNWDRDHPRVGWGWS